MKKVLDATVLKIVAMVTMLIDHIGYVYYPNETMLRFFGRISFPVYAWMIAESVYYTEERKDEIPHTLRLLRLALISEIPYDLLFENTLFMPTKNNVIFTMLFGYIICILIHKTDKPILQGTIVLTGSILGYLLGFDYGLAGILLIVIFDLIQRNTRETGTDHPQLILLALFAFSLYYLFYGISNISLYTFADRFERVNWMYLGVFLAWPFLALYNGEKGCTNPIFVWTYRLFYPLHMVVMLLLSGH